MQLYIEAIKVDPQQPLFYTNAANCYFKLSQFERSIEMSDEALSLNPSNTKAVYRRGLAYGELGLYKKAIEDLRRVLKAAPGDADVKIKMQTYEREFQKTLFNKAIKKDEFKLSPESIEKIQVDDGYQGPRIKDGKVDIAFVNELIQWFKQEKRLHQRYAYELMLLAKNLFSKEPNLVRVNIQDTQTMTICGDIHGQFFDLVKIFEMNGLPSDQHIYVLSCLHLL